jgi:antitoxin (DNA-binding transcriptional repressor) of toxin-antitoxin stability system
MTIALEEAQAQLAELIQRMPAGQEMTITHKGQIIAYVRRLAPQSLAPRQPGMMKDKILFIADDFDAPLEDFREYME